ncbi:hypothetical protein CCC_03465 [Paramagnetospirillum magnetotacticum MS-1]|uniref:Uncharacterized protein n=1 Tax=Paramagnetospirillum magnetotacticum MS-1 TaxID=272627 RepID=A0A0C2UCK6_PARME|nr:hypothetical protein CCC_03465 [Paramagnetospirillum magnetotacticum MS-1]
MSPRRGTHFLHGIKNVEVNAANGYSEMASNFLAALAGGNKL